MFIDLILSHVLRSICIIILGIIAEISIVIYDVNTRGALTGFSLVGIVVVCAVAAVAFVNQHKLDRFINLARFRRNQRGAVLAVIMPVAFVLGVIAGQVAAGSIGPGLFCLVLCGMAILTVFVLHIRRPRRNRRKGRGIVGRALTWRQIRRASAPGRLLSQRGEGDLNTLLVVVAVVAIIFFLFQGRCAAAVCLLNPLSTEAVWQAQIQVDEHLKRFTLPPRATSFPLPKPKAVSAPIPSMAGLLACGVVGLVAIRRRGGAR